MNGGKGLQRVMFGASENIGACFTREQLRTKLSYINRALLPEVAMVGRSNTGKSSLINAMLNRTKARNKACRVGKQPGVTQSLQMFSVETDWKKKRKLILSDLPGYGYAKADKYKLAEMSHVVGKYIQHSERLKRVMLLIDCQAGITINDTWMMELLNHEDRNFQVVLTKCDKIHAVELNKLVRKVSKVAESFRPDDFFPVIPTSCVTGFGIGSLRTQVAHCAFAPAAKKLLPFLIRNEKVKPEEEEGYDYEQKYGHISEEATPKHASLNAMAEPDSGFSMLHWQNEMEGMEEIQAGEEEEEIVVDWEDAAAPGVSVGGNVVTGDVDASVGSSGKCR